LKIKIEERKIFNKIKDIDLVREVDIMLIILSVGCIAFNILDFSLITLNENQTLYFFSTGAQVVAALFGITLAGYTFFNDKLDKEVQNDDSLYDAVESLKSEYYHMIIKMGIICILSILLSLLNIALYSDLGISTKIYTYILNQTSILLSFEILYVVIFIIKLTDPTKILKISSSLKSKVEDDDPTGDFGEFLKNYNQLEKKIISTANAITFGTNKTVSQNYRKEYRPQIFQALNILLSKEIIDKVLVEEIDSIRKYRNYVVHSLQPTVNKEVSQRIIGLIDKVNKHIDLYISHNPDLKIEYED